MTTKKSGKKSVFRMITDIISWTIFALLMLLAAFLIYYVIANNIYARKGERFKPIVSLYTIISGSMLPTIQVYDVVVNQRIDNPENLKENDIITFISQSKINYGETITHRIIKVTYEDGKYYYTTKGDYNLVPDETPVEFNNVIGKVILKIPQLGQAQFFLLKQGSKLFLILIPAFGILIYDLLKMLNLFGTKQKVDKSLQTKDYKLTKEEEDNLKKKIKERLKSSDDASLKTIEEEPKILENKKDQELKLSEDTKDDTNELKKLAALENQDVNKEKEDDKASNQDENKDIEEEKQELSETKISEEKDYDEKPSEEKKEERQPEEKHSEEITEPEPKEEKKVDKEKPDTSSKQINKNNQNKPSQSKKKQNQTRKNSSNNNQTKKKTTSKKTNSNSKTKKTNQDIDVDKVLEKIKEKKY